MLLFPVIPACARPVPGADSGPVPAGPASGPLSLSYQVPPGRLHQQVLMAGGVRKHGTHAPQTSEGSLQLCPSPLPPAHPAAPALGAGAQRNPPPLAPPLLASSARPTASPGKPGVGRLLRAAVCSTPSRKRWVAPLCWKEKRPWRETHAARLTPTPRPALQGEGGEHGRGEGGERGASFTQHSAELPNSELWTNTTVPSNYLLSI